MDVRPPEGYMSVTDAQERMGVTKARAYQLVEMRRIPSMRTKDGRVWVPREAVELRVAAQRRMNSNQCVTVAEAAAFHGVSDKTVREWYAEGLLHASKVGNRLCLSPSEVTTFIPPTFAGPGRPPKGKPTHTLWGRRYPDPRTLQTNNHERNADDRDGERPGP